MADEPLTAWMSTELWAAFRREVDGAMPCILCGQFGHPPETCDVKSAGPKGVLAALDEAQPLTAHFIPTYIVVPHELLVDSGGHVCGPDCPPEPDPLPPLPWRIRASYALRRARRRLARVGGLRLVHKDRIDQDDD